MQSRILHVGKGKVERAFRTVKDKFFNCIDWNSITEISQAQEMYTEFVNKEYNNKMHTAIETTPKERFMKDYSNIQRKTDKQIEESFLHRETRNVRKDATISFRDYLYEVPQEYIKKQIIIKFKPNQTEELYIYNDKDERVCTIKPIDKISNSKIKRREKISMYRKEEESNV